MASSIPASAAEEPVRARSAGAAGAREVRLLLASLARTKPGAIGLTLGALVAMGRFVETRARGRRSTSSSASSVR